MVSKIIIEVVLGVMLIVILAFAIMIVRDKGINFLRFGSKDPYCDKSGLTLSEFSQKLDARIKAGQMEQAKLLYAMSASCFSPDKITMDETQKHSFFCAGSKPNTFEVTDKKALRWLESYCA